MKSTDILHFLASLSVASLLSSNAFGQAPQGSSTPDTSGDNGTETHTVIPEMIKVEGGFFKAIKKRVKTFYIGKYEVTLYEYNKAVKWAKENDKDYDLQERRMQERRNKADLPVCYILWVDTLKYCNAKSEMEGLKPVYYVGNEVFKKGRFSQEDWDKVKLKRGANGYRLPTEAEWEWAARGGKKSKGYSYAGSDNLDEICSIMHWGGPTKVGTKQPNELGLYDMNGNVSERTWDFIHKGGSHRFAPQAFVNKIKLASRNQKNFGQNHSDLHDDWQGQPIGFRLAKDSRID